MMMDPFFLAKATSSVSCSRVAAAPVGLFGEQKKMMSVRPTWSCGQEWNISCTVEDCGVNAS